MVDVAAWFDSWYNGSLALNVLLLAVILAVVSLFIWKFYRAVSKRNLISLDLSQYNHSAHPLLNKVLAAALYLLEYIVIMPLLIFLWFAALAIVILLIVGGGASGLGVDHALLIAAGLIGAIRILAYFNGEISKDLAKLFPFMVLSLFLISPDSFDIAKIQTQLDIVPSLFSNLFSYVFVIFSIEIVLRLFYTMYEFWRSEDGKTKDAPNVEDAEETGEE